VEPKQLRDSELVRAEAAKKATAIAERMAIYMAGYSAPHPTVKTEAA
jgi:hypothetical protein